MAYTKEMETWFSENRSLVEFYVLHRLVNDKAFRANALKAIVFYDFSTEAYSAMCAAIMKAHAMCALVNFQIEIPEPLTWEFIEPYLVSADADEDLFEDYDLEHIHIRELIPTLADTTYNETWPVVEVYFEMWMMDARSKRYSQGTLAKRVADPKELADAIETDRAAAASVIYSREKDDYAQYLDGDDEAPVERTSTGIKGVDDIMNGGFTNHESHLFFSGSGGGKTALACMLAGIQVMAKRPVLYISTETPVNEISGRLFSSVCRLPVGEVQEYTTLKGMRSYAASKSPTVAARFADAEAHYRKYFMVNKVSVEDSLDPYELFTQYTTKFQDTLGVFPSLVIFDWIGRSGDQAGSNSSAERSAAWEKAADRVVVFCENHPCCSITFAQAVSNAHMFNILTQSEIAVSKALPRQMTTAVGLTNTADLDRIKAGESPDKCIMDEQNLCAAKSRKSPGIHVKIKRNLKYQRFTELE